MAADASASSGVVLVTGASRGIGFGLVEAFAAKKWRVIATARDPSKADKLQALAKANSQVSVIPLNVADSKSVATLPTALAELKVDKIDILFNNAGILPVTPSLDHKDLTVDQFMETYRTNVVGAWDVSQTLLPLVRKAQAPRVIHMSSVAGSIGTATGLEPAIYSCMAPYRASKSALNNLALTQSREWNLATVKAQSSGDAKAIAAAAPLITVVALHPGWVDTEMGHAVVTSAAILPQGLVAPPLSLAQSVAGVLNVTTTVKPHASVVFLDFEGKTLPW